MTAREAVRTFLPDLLTRQHKHVCHSPRIRSGGDVMSVGRTDHGRRQNGNEFRRRRANRLDLDFEL